MIDWSKAPEWAQYHAYDSDGRGGWHESKPYVNKHISFWRSDGHNWPSVYTMPTGTHWKESLEQRPKP